MKFNLLFFLLLLSGKAFSQQLLTADIDRFWQAYDQLATADSYADSLRIMQEEYINRASPEFAQLMRLRNYSAQAYVECLGQYPKFWKSIRPHTLQISHRQPSIDSLFQRLSQQLPNFRRPGVCIGIGVLNSAGTQYEGIILIGAEMLAADSSMNRSELSPWLQRVVGREDGLLATLAHESMHVQQRQPPARHLLQVTISEGAADFLTQHFLGLNMNTHLQEYGRTHECRLWREFSKDLEQNAADLSAWLYNGERAKERPADLGYFIGYRIAEAFYRQARNKEKAIRYLLDPRKYKKVFRKSKYPPACSTP